LPLAQTASNIIQRATNNIQSSAIQLNDKLFKKESTLYRKNKNGEWIRLGFGLFTNQDIPKNTDICYFFGDLKRPEDAEPYYQIQINLNLVLDCAKQCRDGYYYYYYKFYYYKINNYTNNNNI
jgi:hypothetical protein